MLVTKPLRRNLCPFPLPANVSHTRVEFDEYHPDRVRLLAAAGTWRDPQKQTLTIMVDARSRYIVGLNVLPATIFKKERKLPYA